MAQISGKVVALYLFDVAETIDLDRIGQLIQEPVAPSRLLPRPATPAYVQYDKPPVTFEGDLDEPAGVGSWKVRYRIYDYGIISVALTQPLAGGWQALVDCSRRVLENPALEQCAEGLCRRAVERVRAAMTGLRARYLSEDYVVFAVHSLEPAASAQALVQQHGREIALTLRGETQELSEQERQRILQQHISYFDNDLVVPSWNGAFVVDTPQGADATIEILEFANSQLLEFRYYDQRLDAELSAVYGRLKKPRWYAQFFGTHYTRAARELHALFIDVNELTDRSENTLKFVGEPYAARLYSAVTDRLGLDRWKANVQDKLETLDDVYRFAVEQSGMSRGHVMELAVVLILVIELVMAFAGHR